MYEYDDYYQFIKSNSDLNSGIYYETNRFTNTLLGLTARNNNNNTSNKNNFNNCECKKEKVRRSPMLDRLEKSIDSETFIVKNSDSKRSFSASVKFNDVQCFNSSIIPNLNSVNIFNALNNSKRTSNSEAETHRTKVIEDLKFEFNFYSELFPNETNTKSKNYNPNRKINNDDYNNNNSKNIENYNNKDSKSYRNNSKTKKKPMSDDLYSYCQKDLKAHSKFNIDNEINKNEKNNSKFNNRNKKMRK